MAAIAGYTGTVDGACNEVKSWEVTLTLDALDSTDFCSLGWREFVEGLQGGSGTIVSTERYVGSSSITLANSAGGVSISGNVIWTEETFANSVDGIMEYTHSFVFTGAVTVS